MSLSKKIRFDVFKRDGFKCAYCGQTPPLVTLEVDHINPKSTGGQDDINNLITACFDCNRGKRDDPLGKIPLRLEENLEILKEKEAQLAAYNKVMKSIKNRIDKNAKEVESVFSEHFSDRGFTTPFCRSVKTFLKSLPLETVKEAMEIACSTLHSNPTNALKYFCGICWKKIREKKCPE